MTNNDRDHAGQSQKACEGSMVIRVLYRGEDRRPLIEQTLQGRFPSVRFLEATEQEMVVFAVGAWSPADSDILGELYVRHQICSWHVEGKRVESQVQA